MYNSKSLIILSTINNLNNIKVLHMLNLQNNKNLIIGAAVVGAVIAILFVINLSQNNSTNDKNTKSSSVSSVTTKAATTSNASVTTSVSTSVVMKTMTKTELSLKNGKGGADCWVAVDGKVYEIFQGKLWKDGAHTPSPEQAMCGIDGSAAIVKSPHGKKKLETLKVVADFK